MPSYRIATPADPAPCWAMRTDALRVGCATHYPPATVEALCAAAPPASMPGLFAAGGAIVAEEDGRIVGYAVLDRTSGEIDAVFVSPACQGRGIARRLLAGLEAMAAERGISHLFLSASLNAAPFYERAGFLHVRDALYRHRGGFFMASVYMEKQLALPAGTAALSGSGSDAPPGRR
ncbi:GNAT family N-acetyltransferase [Massilia sp. YIM B02443]|uniref:GNAT family N-acetyltransferase n=1 Tax=Massilia sp. YIM B02443 TaxID=3050127 RepID=UPI0025B638A0|nr:GNAT family N-acetyltransferase [Massilia sp. YIM B02443]MDN4037109.1 GNAT family N-acetyltransferase [Massilia sp. YIM B02443]